MSNLKVIRKEGGSRVLTLTDILPKDWKYVEISKISEKPKSITIKLDKVE